MKKVILVRHAKSSWEFNLPDHKRPLNDRGLNDAHLVSLAIKSTFKKPDSALSSHAIRAKTTADIFAENLDFEPGFLEVNSELYDFSGNGLVSVIKQLPNILQSVMLFGHNHALTYFVNAFGSTYIDNVPTCGLVTIEFDIDNWANLSKGKTIFTLFPRDLR